MLAGVLGKLATNKGSMTTPVGKGKQDERGGAFKKEKSSSKGGEGGGSYSSSGREKRQAFFKCVNPLCQLLDERPVSVTAHHCGMCLFVTCLFLLPDLTCTIYSGNPTCPRSERRIQELMELGAIDHNALK